MPPLEDLNRQEQLLLAIAVLLRQSDTNESTGAPVIVRLADLGIDLDVIAAIEGKKRDAVRMAISRYRKSATSGE